MRTLLTIRLCIVLAEAPVFSMTVPSSSPEEIRSEVPVSGGGGRPAWAGTWGYIGLGCAALGILFLANSNEKDDNAGVVLLLPGFVWLMFFAR